MNDVFKALADPSRRQLLDLLRTRDGQSLSELEQGLSAHTDMTRFGVMKHLKVLEEASLITTTRVGRFKHHFLNAVPLQEAIERWIEPLIVKPAARALLTLKSDLEEETAMSENPSRASAFDTDDATRPDVVQETFIRTTPQRLWRALTDPDEVGRYHFIECNVSGGDTVGESHVLSFPDGSPMLTMHILHADEPHRLEMTFEPKWEGPDMPKSRCVYEIEEIGGLCRLRVMHFGVPKGQEEVADGWSRTIAGLKTWLETGERLAFPPPQHGNEDGGKSDIDGRLAGAAS
ncbi:MAG: SRPBCC domain-containing protein [Pseudomonadota bacterium]